MANARLGASDAPELLIFGHSHVTTMERLHSRVFANPGAWMDAPRFLRIVPDRVDLCRWDGAGHAVEQTLARRG